MSSTTPIRDRYHAVIGYLDERSDGDVLARTRGYSVLGRWDKHYNRTYDKQGQFIGEGNHLMMLIYRGD